jgi:hypothetical protein
MRARVITYFVDGVYCTSDVSFIQTKTLVRYGMKPKTLCYPGTSSLDPSAVDEAFTERERALQKYMEGTIENYSSIPLPTSKHAEEWQRIEVVEKARKSMLIDGKETDFYP